MKQSRNTPKRYLNRPFIEWLKFHPVDFTPCVPHGEPTQEEITARCAEVRAGWDDARWRLAAGVRLIDHFEMPTASERIFLEQ